MIGRARNWIAEQDLFVLVARLTLLVLVLNSNEEPLLLAFSVVAALGLFLQEGWLRQPWPWLVIAGVLGGGHLLVWWRVDDHVVVSTYWALAIGLSRFAVDPRRVLALSARLLVGLVFGLAFGWKVWSSQFTSTDFFRYELLIDERFRPVAQHVGGTPDHLDTANNAALKELVSRGGEGDVVVLREGPRNGLVATGMTIWGIAIEGVVALVFLVPLRSRWRRLRAVALLAFSFTTYVVVPVAGFGCLLMTLGLAHLDRPEERHLRAILVGSFGFLAVWGTVFPLVVL